MSAYCVRAEVYNGKHLILTGSNIDKTHPLQARFASHPERIKLHAEIDALRKLLVYTRELSHLTVHVKRYRKDGTLAMAKPCEGCERALWYFGVGHVEYTDERGQLRRLW